ncbi:hypothetical protein GGI12_000049 [Dipsacomyces acuminosporus]|nr:hypothetical protein GGI12_000049 [Dipsacomyces acuminosporus]
MGILAAMMASSYTAADLANGAVQNAQANNTAAATPTAAGGLHAAPVPAPATTTGDNNGTGAPAATSKSGSKSTQRKRARATSEQVTVLESVFLVNRSPASRLREDLAARLGMAPRQVQVWFQNRRAKEKTQQRNPRGLQQHPAMLLDQLAYANMNPEIYSMAVASALMPGADSLAAAAAAPTSGGYMANPATGLPIISQQPQQQHLAGAPMTLAAATAANNPWMQWSLDMAHQGQMPLPPEHQQYIQVANGHTPVLATGAATAGTALNASLIAGAPYLIDANAAATQMPGSIADGSAISSQNEQQPAVTLESAVSTVPHTPIPVAAVGGSSMSVEGKGTDTTIAVPTHASATGLLHATNNLDSRSETVDTVSSTAGHATQAPSATIADNAIASTAISAAASPMTTTTTTTTTITTATPTTLATAAAAPGSETLRAISTPAPEQNTKTEVDTAAKKASSSSEPTAKRSPQTPSTAVNCNASMPSIRAAGQARRPAPLTLVAQNSGNDATHLGAMAMQGAPVQLAGGNGDGNSSNTGVLAPAGIPMGVNVGNLSMSLGMGSVPMGGRIGYSSFIPEIASYMVLDASLLTVGTWQRVSMPDTELTCVACVEPPPLKPVQRPGNHRPAELDSLVGEFQWIISNCGVRYKMVLPYSAISRIKFRESPDPAASLIDSMTESVINPQTAVSLLNNALKNPQAKGELSIHVYDPPKYFFQTETGTWKEIEDFSENRSASNTSVHIISGSFVALFCQLRILLATCSRLKIAADPLMTLWLGSMDDPYSIIAGVPHNTWIPCAETAMCLHSVKPNGEQEQQGTGAGYGNREVAGSSISTGAAAATAVVGASPAFNIYIPASGASSAVETLTPTPTSVSCPHPLLPLNGMAPTPGSARHSVFALPDSLHQYPSSIVAPIANAAAGAMGSVAPPFKTQRSASLPFIRPIIPPGSGAKANPSSGLCRTIDDEDMLQQVDSPMNPASTEASSGASRNTPTQPAQPASGVANTPPASGALPLRHRTSCNHLRRTAPYQVAPPGGSPRVNSPQMSPSPFWYAHNLRRASRDSLSGHFQPSMLGPNGQPTTPLGSALPPGMLGRRESDAELALAMNNAFVNGDVFGNHRGLSDSNSLSNGGVPPSPLSNIAIAGAPDIQPGAESNLAQAMAKSANANPNANPNSSSIHENGTDASETVAQSNASDVGSHCAQNESGAKPTDSQMPVTNSNAADTTIKELNTNNIPLSSVSPQATVSTFANAQGEAIDMSNAEMVAAIFHAINSSTEAIAATSAHPSSQPAPLGLSQAPQSFTGSAKCDPMLALDPSAFMLPQMNNAKSPVNGMLPTAAINESGAQSMDWCFDWSQSVCGSQPLVSSFLTPGASNESAEGDMNIDWSSSVDDNHGSGLNISNANTVTPSAVVKSAAQN